MAVMSELIDRLVEDDVGASASPVTDVLSLAPGMTHDQAYELQFARVARQVAAGDRFIGFQASMTSAGSHAAAPTMPLPLIGSMLSSHMRRPGETVTMPTDLAIFGGEIGALLRRDIVGPGATPMSALAAIDGYFPALEIVCLKAAPSEHKRSDQHLIATHKSQGFVAMGEMLSAREAVDPRLEGMVVNLNGRPVHSGTGVEAMGSPLHVLAAMANSLARFGLKLEAGTAVITGSLCPPVRLGRGDREASVEFTTLGSVALGLEWR